VSWAGFGIRRRNKKTNFEWNEENRKWEVKIAQIFGFSFYDFGVNLTPHRQFDY
jgi:hypothetical protein